MIHWVDTSVLVQSHHKYHPRARVPQFWSWLEREVRNGQIMMPHADWTELCKGNDWLKDWCKNREQSPLNSMPDERTQNIFRDIADRVKDHWKRVPHQWTKMLQGGDLWVIAHAKATNGIAVSEESRSGRNETDSLKIPDVCNLPGVNVKWMDTFQMLDALGADFSEPRKPERD
jgi:hypothetical protein